MNRFDDTSLPFQIPLTPSRFRSVELSGSRHEIGQLHRKRVLAGCVRGGFDDCRVSVLVDADDREHRDAFVSLVALLHEILLCRHVDDCLSSQLLADQFPPVSFHDVEVKGFARFAGIAAIGVDR